jgi:hypothetical protein
MHVMPLAWISPFFSINTLQIEGLARAVGLEISAERERGLERRGVLPDADMGRFIIFKTSVPRFTARRCDFDQVHDAY